MLHFVTSYMKQNKSRKQTLESAQYGLEISFKAKNSILSNGNTFLISLNFGARFMILRPVDTSYLRLEKLR